MNIYHDLERMKQIAVLQAEDHNKNYNVVLLNPDEKGEFNANKGSTYEIVADSYFSQSRPNAKLLHRTDDLMGIVRIQFPFDNKENNGVS